MSRKLYLTVPKGFENARAQVSILGHDLTIKRSTTLREVADGIELDPGVYGARAVLADGRVLQAAFKIDKRKKKTTVELAAIPSRASIESRAHRGVALEGVTFDSVALSPEGHPAPVFKPPSLSLVSLDFEGAVRPVVDIPLPADAAGKVVVAPLASARFVRARYPAGELFVAAPTSESEAVGLTFKPGNPGDVDFDLADDEADLFLAYLGSRRVEQLSQLVEGYWDRSRQLLRGKYDHPIAATVGAYVMVLVGSPQSEVDCLFPGNWLDRWTRNLFTDFPWLSDGLCIRAEILARRGEHEEAVRLLCLLRERGLPMFTFGFRFAIDRLSGYRTAADTGRLLDNSHKPRIEAVLEPLLKLATMVDFQRPVLSFLRPAAKSD